jgi:hypothetical protein
MREIRLKNINKKQAMWWTGIAAAVCAATISMFTDTAYAYISRTDAPPGTAGTFQPDQQISGGTVFKILSTTDPNLMGFQHPQDQWKYGPDGIPINGGNDTNGGIWDFDHTHGVNGPITANNGYKMVGVSSVQQWIAALKGDPSYVNSHRYDTTFIDGQGDQFKVSNISQIVEMSGASFEPGPFRFNSAVYVTDPAWAEIGIVDATKHVQKGQAVQFYTHAHVEAYHSTWHFEYVEVVDANGNDVTSKCFDNANLQGKAPYNGETLYTPDGHVMQEVAGGGTTSYPPTPQTWVNGGSSTPNSIDTSQLQDGWYTIRLYVKDWFNRGNSAPAQAQFEVGNGGMQPPPPPPPTYGGGGNNGGGSGGSGGGETHDHLPIIELTASPMSMVSGQSSTITYTVDDWMPPDNYVTIKGTGGAHAWNSSRETDLSKSYVEVETPPPGQTITVTYEADLHDPTGAVYSSATLTLTWTNAWTGGTITLTANPTVLPVQQGTVLVAKSTSDIPSGCSLIIWDQSTNQQVAVSTTKTVSGVYVSNTSRTDTFVAYVSNGYQIISPYSNTVSVSWVNTYVSANPEALPINRASTLTANANNMPPGYYLLLVDKSSGAVLGSTTQATLTVQQTKSTPQTVSYRSYISSTPDLRGVIMESQPVSVQWYSVTLTANPTSLPTGQATTLTATAQNVPSGYSLVIINQTTGKVVAAGPPGQTTLQTTDTQTTPQTDTYVAEVAVVPPSGDQLVVAEKGRGIYISKPGADITKPGAWTYLGNPSTQADISVLGYDPNTDTIYASGPNTNGFWYYSGGAWHQVSTPGLIMYSALYNPLSHTFFVAGRIEAGGAHNGSYGLWIADPMNPGQFTPAPSFIWDPYRTDILYDLTLDPNTGTMYAFTESETLNVFDSNGNKLSAGGAAPWRSGNRTGKDGRLYYDPHNKHIMVTTDEGNSPTTYWTFTPPWSFTPVNLPFHSGGGGGSNQATFPGTDTTAFALDHNVLLESNGQFLKYVYFFDGNGSPMLVSGVTLYNGTIIATCGETMYLSASNQIGMYQAQPGSPTTFYPLPDPATGDPGNGSFQAILTVHHTASIPTQVQAVSDPVDVTWYNDVLQLYDPGVYHTDHWLDNLDDWNTKHPANQRSLSTFWAGEELVFKVRPSFTTGIANASVTVSGLQYSPYVPIGAPPALSVQLTVDNTSGLLVGNTDPSLSTWLQYLRPGTYTATFTVTANGKTATAQAQFAIDGKWTDYWRQGQVY